MQRKLPNFLIIGAAKAGTTSLYNYLKQHPQIFMSPIKETNYFAYEGPQTKTFLGEQAHTDFPITTIEEYVNLFEHVRNESVIGEASPLYLESLVAAERIQKLLPEAKLLAILRNPADRALSGYMMAVREGSETRGIEDALGEDGHYVQVGLYYEKLKRYFNLFPREQIKVYLYEDLHQDTLSIVQDIFNYLDVDTAFKPDVASHHNVGGLPKSNAFNLILVKISQNKVMKSIAPDVAKNLYRAIYKKNLGDRIEIPQDLRNRLLFFYRGDILKVQELIQRDLISWLPP